MNILNVLKTTSARCSLFKFKLNHLVDEEISAYKEDFFTMLPSLIDDNQLICIFFFTQFTNELFNATV